MMTRYQEKLYQALQAGELPDFMKQEEQILEGSDYDRQAIDYIRKIINKLRPDSFDKNAAIKIYVSASPVPNAITFPTQGARPIIVVNKGLLDLAQTEDELAWVIAHELRHIYLREQFSEHKESNKVEESLCDCESLEDLDRGGYQRDAMISMAERWSLSDSDVKRGYLAMMFDPHPSWKIRAKNFATVLAAYEREKGLSRAKKSTPLPEFIMTGKDRRWPDYLDAKLEKEQYEKRAVHEKMQVLAALILEENIFSDVQIFEKRIKKIKTLVLQLKANKINLEDQRDRRAFGKLIDSILIAAGPSASSNSHDGLMDLAFQAAGYKHQPYPVHGTVEEFVHLGKHFVAAETEIAAAECAVKMERMIKDHQNILNRNLLSSFQIRLFTIPDLKKSSRFFQSSSETSAVALPWNKHLEWSKTNSNIREILKKIGVLRVVKKYYSVEEKAALGYKEGEMGTPNDAMIDVYDESGSVCVLYSYDRIKDGKLFPVVEKAEAKTKLVETFPSDDEEQKRLNQVDIDQAAMEIDWSLLTKESKEDEESYRRHPFIIKYQEQLQMQWTFKEGGFGFAKKFIEHIKELAKINQVAADKIFREVLDLQTTRPLPSDESYDYALGVSTHHPFIQYALQNFDKFGEKIREYELFTHVTMALRLRLPSKRKQDLYDYAVNRAVPFLPDSLFRKAVQAYKKKEKDYQVQKHSLESKAAIPLEARWVFHDYETLFHFERPQLLAAREKKELKMSDAEFRRRAYSMNNLLKIPCEFDSQDGRLRKGFPCVWAYEAYLMLKNNPEQRLTTDEFAYIALMKNKLKLCEGRGDFRGEEVVKVFTDEFSRREADFFTQTLEEKDPYQMIEKFYLLKEFKTYFRDFRNIEKLQNRIRQHFQGMSSPEERKKFLEKLLFTQQIRFDPKYRQLEPIIANCEFIDPQFKKWVIEEYAKALAEVLGKDKPEEQVANRESKAGVLMNPKFAAVDDILKMVPLNVAVPVLRKLADTITAQKTFSYYIRDRINRVTKEKLLKMGGSLGGVAEILLTELPKSKDKTLIADTIYFLLSAKEDFNYDDYVRRISASNPQTNLTYQLAAQCMGRSMQSLDSLYEENREQVMQRFQSAQNFFRDLSLEQQTVAIDQLLFPAEKPLRLQEGKAFVLDSIFGSKGGSGMMKMLANALCGKKVTSLRGDKETRQIVESYLEALEEVALDPAHKASIESRERLILSAMLVANAKTQQAGEKSGRGEALRQVLEVMGPAGRKLAQAIESHPETPADIKFALKSAKTNAAPPSRWEVHEWVDQFYKPQQAEQKMDGIQYLDEMLGSGSYGVTMKAVKNSGATTAITFLRPHMLEQSEDEFMILGKAAKILIKKNPVFKPFDDMQREAALASRKEVDMEIAARQQEVAKTLYSNLEVRVGEIHFQFGVAEWVGSSPHYKETQVMPGSHFNDLDGSPEFKGIKKETAQALLAAELYLLLKGGPIDNDRHGGQQKLFKTGQNQVYVGNFDFGGMTLLSQTPWQKELLGSMVGEAMWESNKPLGAHAMDSVLLNTLAEKYIKQYAKSTFLGKDGKRYVIGNEKVKQFVGRIKRSLLALGDFFSELQGEPEKVKGIIGAILASGDMDPDINKAMRAKLGLFEYKLDELAQSDATKQIRIRRG